LSSSTLQVTAIFANHGLDGSCLFYSSAQSRTLTTIANPKGRAPQGAGQWHVCTMQVYIHPTTALAACQMVFAIVGAKLSKGIGTNANLTGTTRLSVNALGRVATNRNAPF
jgi:hypothetical protein